jgi:two-component system response regulator FixJ
VSNADRPPQEEALNLRGTVYVVDDDDDVRESMALLLRSFGLDCHAYRSGKELLANLLTLDPGCVFLDFRMGGLNGLQVLSELRWMELEWPVVVMTGHGDVSVGAKAIALGAIDFLEKPFGEEVLIEVLGRAFALLGASAPTDEA